MKDVKVIIQNLIDEKNRLEEYKKQYSEALENAASDLEVNKQALSVAVNACASGKVRKKMNEVGEIETLLGEALKVQ